MPEPDGLTGRNYRIRRIIVKLDLDVYDSMGLLETRGLSDEIAIPEAAFPPAVVVALAQMTGMGRGFATLAPSQVAAPTPTDAPVAEA